MRSHSLFRAHCFFNDTSQGLQLLEARKKESVSQSNRLGLLGAMIAFLPVNRVRIDASKRYCKVAPQGHVTTARNAFKNPDAAAACFNRVPRAQPSSYANEIVSPNAEHSCQLLLGQSEPLLARTIHGGEQPFSRTLLNGVCGVASHRLKDWANKQSE
jgi:hypothetical protein